MHKVYVQRKDQGNIQFCFEPNKSFRGRIGKFEEIALKYVALSSLDYLRIMYLSIP